MVYEDVRGEKENKTRGILTALTYMCLCCEISFGKYGIQSPKISRELLQSQTELECTYQLRVLLKANPVKMQRCLFPLSEALYACFLLSFSLLFLNN